MLRFGIDRTFLTIKYSLKGQSRNTSEKDASPGKKKKNVNMLCEHKVMKKRYRKCKKLSMALFQVAHDPGNLYQA